MGIKYQNIFTKCMPINSLKFSDVVLRPVLVLRPFFEVLVLAKAVLVLDGLKD